MKSKLLKQIFSILLAATMLIGLLPTAALSAFAASPSTIVDSLDFEFNLERLPKAGEDVVIYGDEILTSDVGRPYSIQPRYRWHSDIPNGYDNDVVRHFYEINDSNESVGYSFEAGKTYIFHMACSIDNDFKDTHRFYSRAETRGGKKTTVTFSNLPSSSYYIVAAEASTDYLGIYVAITIDGVCPYEDIKSVCSNWDGNFVYPPMAGRQAGYAVANYGNFTEKRRWEGSFDTSEYGGAFYKAGEHYTYTIVYTARDGYKFASDVEYSFDRGRPDSIELSDDRKTLTVIWEFDVSDVVFIDNVTFFDADSNGYLDWLLPDISNGLTDCYQLDVDADAPYRETDCSGWRDENDKPVSELSKGNVYFFRQTYTMKNSDTHQFAKDVTSVVEGLSEGGYTAEVQWVSGEEIIVSYIFAEGYGRGTGKSKDAPVKCNSFFALKWALENPNIQYIELGDCENTVPLVKKQAGEKDTYLNAITVKDNKYLTISGCAEFTAISVDETAYFPYKDFICVPEGAKLVVDGQGTITYNGYHTKTDNAVFTVRYGELTIDGCTVNGVVTKSGAYSAAITGFRGNITIKNGTFNGYNLGSAGIGAVMVLGGDTLIENGRFEVLGAGVENYGFVAMSSNSDVTIERGAFYSKGIKMPTDSMSLSRYADSGNHVAMIGTTVYETYEITQPDIDNRYVTPLRICKIVKTATLDVDTPVAGQTVDTTPEISEGIKVKSVKWYANGSKIAMSSSASFALNSTYSVVITIEAEENSVLGDIDIFKGKINGKSATVTSVSGGYELSFNFGQCKNTITTVYLTGLTSPAEFELPDYSLIADTQSYDHVSLSTALWYEDGVLMDSDARFKHNSYYVVKIPVWAKSNYIFNVDAEGIPMLDCYIDGIKAYSESYEGYSTTKYALIVLELGYLHGTVIENASLSIELPVAGQTPHYNATNIGNTDEYYIDEGKNSWYEEYVGPNTGVCTFYKIRGVSWYDVTAGDMVYENETFIAGHTYSVSIEIHSREGYEFLFKTVPFGDDLILSATVNGEAAEVIRNGTIQELQTAQTVTYTFACQPVVVSEIEITDFSFPTANKTPDYTMTFGSDLYQLDTDFGTNNTGIEWYTGAGDLLSPSDTFKAGETYMMRVRFVPVAIDGTDMCKFHNGTCIYINGEKVKETNSNHINKHTNKMELFYYFNPVPADSSAEGDVNGDGSVDVFDYMTVKSHYFKKYTLTDEEFARADLSPDGSIDVFDYMAVKSLVMAQ